MLHSIATEPVDQSRRTEHVRDAEVLDRLDQLARIGVCRAGRVHVRNDCRHAEGRREEREEGKGRQIDLSRLDAVHRAERLHLCGEDPVRVDGAFRHPRRAAREEDRGGIIGTRVGKHFAGPAEAPHVVERPSSPPHPPAGRDQDLRALLRPAEELARYVRFRHADEGRRRRLGETLSQVLDAHARIHQNQYGADLEEGERQSEELEARLDHEDGPHSPLDADRRQAARDAVALLVELAVGEVRVADPVTGVTTARAHDCESMRLAASQRREVTRDVDSRFAAHAFASLCRG